MNIMTQKPMRYGDLYMRTKQSTHPNLKLLFETIKELGLSQKTKLSIIHIIPTETIDSTAKQIVKLIKDCKTEKEVLQKLEKMKDSL